jgi:hypothetical protein
VQSTNGMDTLPRYESGEGVQMMIVNTVANVSPTTATISYTNSDGVSGRITTFEIMTTTAGAGSLMNSMTGGGSVGLVDKNTPFVQLVGGDTGVKSVESIQFSDAVGGFCTIVLVKPLVTMNIYEARTYTEINFVNDKFIFPRIENGAYLNLIMKQGAAQAATLRGELVFVTK